MGEALGETALHRKEPMEMPLLQNRTPIREGPMKTEAREDSISPERTPREKRRGSERTGLIRVKTPRGWESRKNTRTQGKGAL